MVDDTSTAVVYDVFSNRELYAPKTLAAVIKCNSLDEVSQFCRYRDSNVSSVAFNSVYEEMLCYSGQNTLSIRTADFEPHRFRV